MANVSLRNTVAKAIARSGYQLSRSEGARRGALLRHYGVDQVYDVGAAIGLYGQELRRFGFAGRIVSVEPLTEPFVQLSTRARNDPHWDVVQVALGSQPGTADVIVAGNSDSSSLLPMLERHLQAAPHTAAVSTQATEVTTLDLLALEHPLSQRSFLKIDTQGYEGAVLDGASTLLESLIGVQLELSFVPLYAGGHCTKPP